MTDLTELRRIAEAATPGPWFQGRDGRHYESDLDVYSEREPSDTSHDIATHIWSVADAAHIATFDPPTVLALLDRLERAEKAIADALALFRPGASVPLGASIARHTDRLMAEGHRILAGYESTNRENGSER
jgi:hypothetical protein